MLKEIKIQIEKELRSFRPDLKKLCGRLPVPTELSENIKAFILRKGGRIRPALFSAAYLGYSRREAPGLYRSAISVELLHDFILIHDDIIDGSEFRRGAPSMHRIFDSLTRRRGPARYNGRDLAMVLGDILYALGISCFLSIKETLERKERALKELTDYAVCTGAGEFLELLFSTKDIEKMTREDIYGIYDMKTGAYSFAAPLVIGSTLAGAPKKDIATLRACGMDLGRAYQIKDDLEDLGRSPASGQDLRETRKTILLWHAYRNSGSSGRSALKKILLKTRPGNRDIDDARQIIISSGAEAFAIKEIRSFVHKARSLYMALRMRRALKEVLNEISSDLLSQVARLSYDRS